MLQSIRDKAQGIVAWVIVSLIIITFALWGIDRYALKGGNSDIAAKVNGHKITWREVENLSQKYQNYLSQSNPKMLAQLDPKLLRQHVQHQLISSIALQTEAKKKGFLISEDQIIKEISNNPQFQEDSKFSTSKYEQFLKHNMLTDSDFENRIESKMLIDQLYDGFNLSSFTLDNELNRIMELIFQKRDFGYTIIPIKKFFKNINISDEDIKKYYKQHQHLFVAPEQVKIAYIELALDEFAKSININEEQVEEYYQKHQALYESPEEVEVRHILINAPLGSDDEKSGEARAKIEDLLAQIKLGADFKELAKKHSDDTSSAIHYGNIGRITKGQTVVEEFEKAAFELKNPNDISQVVQTQFGYHIIQLINKQESYKKPYQEVRDLVAKQYRQEQAETMFTDKGEELANLAFENTDSLQTVARKMGLPIKETNFFTKKGSPQGIASIPAITEVAFSEDLLGKTKNSNLIRVDDEHYVILRVVDHIAAKPQTIEEVWNDIKTKLVNNAAMDKAETLGKEILEKLPSISPCKLAKEHGLEWNIERDVERSNSIIDPYILQKAFTIQKAKDQKINYVGFKLPAGNYVILSLSAITTGNTNQENDQLKDQFKKHLVSTLGQMEFQLYERALINQASIKVEKLD